ncbi:MAG: FAD:protein FMN transferase [Natronospirillum sp.]|uniref:FAD:protein FMN transferase n=1 Tax=Natronospirillum sp. TaxID=2812955 RepID=UPI0025F95F92|nr:FAD:protein FMN transferase [Natronospirillum sp.]MCH8552881.1 FAD:protein FMN transferase [Natronospirillum sp.]
MTRPLHKLWLIKGCLWALLFVSACSSEPGDEPLRFAGGTMGTDYTVQVFAPESEKLTLEVGIQRTLRRVVSSTSVYEPRSDITRFNEAEPGEWVEVSEEVAKIVAAGLEVAERTEGAFEPTILPLVNLWGFGPRGRAEEIPEEDELEAAMAMIGWEAIEVRMDPPALRKSEPREIDLGGIAKGYGADAVAAYLKDQGYSQFLVELGGDMSIRGGKPDGSLWRIAIEKPDEAQRGIYRILELEDADLVTSGDYRNYFEVDGERYSHTIDPRTGFPVDHRLASVSVIAESSLLADAWATALMVLGPEQALETAEREALSVLLIERTDDGFVEQSTGEFTRLLAEENE